MTTNKNLPNSNTETRRQVPADSPDAAYDYALQVLKIRDHSVTELRAKMASRFSAAETEVALQRLLPLLPSPQELSERLTHLLASQGKGSGFIRQTLEAKGLPETFMDPSDEEKRARGLVEQRGASDLKAKQKLFRFLAGRGYSDEIIRRVLGLAEE